MFLLFGCRNFLRIDTTCGDYFLQARLSGVIVVCFGRFWVLQTTSEVFTRISPDNSLERLTECGVGLITDQSSDFWELFVTPFK
jgi:hypothetical protein